LASGLLVVGVLGVGAISFSLFFCTTLDISEKSQDQSVTEF